MIKNNYFNVLENIFEVFKYKDLSIVKDKIKTSFTQNGFIHFKDVFTKDLCNEAKRTLIDFEKDLLENKNEVGLVTEKIDDSIKVKYFQGLYSKNRIFKKFYSVRLIEIAKIILNCDDLYFEDMETHIRNPGGSEIPKHQDNFYFNLKKALGVTCYIALNNHNSDNGGLNYFSKSHIKRVINHDSSSAAGFSSFITEDTVKENNLRKNRIYQPEYETGSITIHHPENVHFANKVSSNTERAFALSVRIFSSSEEIDLDGVERYKKNLNLNRV